MNFHVKQTQFEIVASYYIDKRETEIQIRD